MENKARTVIITGGNRGIGEFITRIFVADGYSVVIGARVDTGLAKKLGDNVRFVRADVRKKDDHKKLVTAALKWTKRLDVYINCAGFSAWSPAVKVTEKFLDDMIDTNLKGAFWGCAAAAEKLKPGGSIINISSVAGKRGSANNSVYCASKFGVTGITQSLAKELGPSGIRVNAVCPVYILTKGLLKALEAKYSPANGNISKYLKQFREESTALGRLPTGEEVAAVCLFLASDAASAVTGQSINVDCGVMPQ